MGLLKGLFDLADDLVSIPTDLVGLTNHHEKKEVLRKAKTAFMEGEISSAEYEKIIKIMTATEVKQQKIITQLSKTLTPKEKIVFEYKMKKSLIEN